MNTPDFPLRLSLREATRYAVKIGHEISPFCRRLEIAGSIRRKRATVGDIDIVCIPRGLDGRAALLDRCGQSAKLLKQGEQYVVFLLKTAVQLDLWFAHEGTDDMLAPDPSNWGMILLARTGSAEHNVYLAQRAREMRLHFNSSRGILRAGKVIASAEEEDIFQALNLDYVSPEKRER